jgi:hypothetical protein
LVLVAVDGKHKYKRKYNTHQRGGGGFVGGAPDFGVRGIAGHGVAVQVAFERHKL